MRLPRATRLPLYRQAQIFARQGIALDRSTLCDWVGRACWWLEPLWRLLRRHVLGSTRIFADDTALAGARPRPGPDQDRAACGATRSTTGPGAASTPPAVVYLYAEDRKGEHPAAHLAEFQGVLQVDGYGGFKRLLENRPPGQIQLAFCWAHCRRRFYELHQATGSPLAEEALRRIGELYRIEAEIRGRPAEERRAVRQERSKPIVEALHAWLTAQLGRVSGKLHPGRGDPLRPAPLAGLVLFLEDGRLELDTNVIERHPADAWGARTPFAGRMAGATGRSWSGGEDGRGGVSRGSGGLRRAFAPPPQSGLAWLRFPSPLVEPDVRISRIRLSPATSGLRIRQVGTPVRQLVRGRAPRRGARRGIGGTPCLAGRSGASTIVGRAVRCRAGSRGRPARPALG